MLGVGVIISLVGLGRWGGQPGTGLLLVVLPAGLISVFGKVRVIRASARPDSGRVLPE
jgi:hypothetical protein